MIVRDKAKPALSRLQCLDQYSAGAIRDVMTQTLAALGRRPLHAAGHLWAAFFMSGCVAASAAPGLLIIHVDAVQLDSSGRETRSGFPLNEVSLEEVRTKKSVSFLAPRRVEVIELEAGAYCVDFVTISRSNVFNFCEKPHIVIAADRITNAGAWRYGIQRDLSAAQRTQAFAFRSEVAQLAAQDFPELLAKYQTLEERALDFTAQPHTQWTERQHQQLRDFYTGMPASKSPPLPLQGIGAAVDAVRAFARPGQMLVSKFFINVDAEGNAVGSTLIESTSDEATQAGVEASKALKFVPAQCSGKPCPMGFPVYLVFR
ncbi:hypothetical protein [Roseateles sp. BYS87W]|uniref:TonB C-terminal domain-containing protein n=1 Tax=Pelomonas baiyunensis TaxID=3299026 RepID=A0ABW7H010_9BURK